MAKTLQTLGAKVIGYKRSNSLTSDINFEVFTGSDLPELLKKSDYVVNVLPATPATNDIFGGKMLEHCKSEFYFYLISDSILFSN